MKKGIGIAIVVAIIGLILAVLFFMDFIFLHLFGLQYDSVGALVLFIFLYSFIEMPITLFVTIISRALTTAGILKTSNGMVTFLLNLSSAWLLIGLVDLMMDKVSISVFGGFLFALISALIGWLINDSEDKTIEELDEEVKKHRQS
ncbi:hypothetical protein A374_18124 [Fictibacillus macauensis ZFHKF-1]|uniref:Uncharacterized protein n=1 Tax=Fictibacillus macauensis ZFHKF-1 TaxID=1196324 RepID=I8UB31_9BACL|nr:YrvL family regulatory protein [Fictibacillus macauensis]EIT83978.1 hypothetical protein A374_18124 [Fictibacillus macauensis ZFHKF-1]